MQIWLIPIITYYRAVLAWESEYCAVRMMITRSVMIFAIGIAGHYSSYQFATSFNRYDSPGPDSIQPVFLKIVQQHLDHWFLLLQNDMLALMRIS
jgi:hypothetical protein